MREPLKSNQEWKQWGKEDPLWGVASWSGKQKGGKSPWTEEDFYALGNSDWQDFVAQWRNYGLNTDKCVEIGCGAGRITKFLGGTFTRVVALDVSEDMIALARKAAGGNVEFVLVDGIHIPLQDNSVTGVFSTHVLQHLQSVEDGLRYFRESYRTLKPGGTIMIHVPLYEFPGGDAKIGGFWRAAYRLIRRLDDARSDLQRRAGRKIVRMTPYPIEELNRHLDEFGFRDVQIRIFRASINADLHPFIFATK